jgi:DMSO reductase anchor subunit
VLGIFGTVLAFALFFCTAMIYACLPFLREWASPLTVINYVLLGGASGFVLAAAFSAFAAPDLTRFFAGWAFILTLLGLVSRVASLVRNSRLKPKSTLQTAIGVKHPRIVQKSMGFMGGSFNTREFFHGRTNAFVRSIKWVFLATAFAVPLALLAAAWSGAPAVLLPIAFLIQYAGLLAERWFFFAQANHPQNLYYQAIA